MVEDFSSDFHFPYFITAEHDMKPTQSEFKCSDRFSDTVSEASFGRKKGIFRKRNRIVSPQEQRIHCEERTPLNFVLSCHDCSATFLLVRRKLHKEARPSLRKRQNYFFEIQGALWNSSFDRPRIQFQLPLNFLESFVSLAPPRDSRTFLGGAED